MEKIQKFYLLTPGVAKAIGLRQYLDHDEMEYHRNKGRIKECRATTRSQVSLGIFREESTLVGYTLEFLKKNDK